MDMAQLCSSLSQTTPRATQLPVWKAKSRWDKNQHSRQ